MRYLLVACPLLLACLPAWADEEASPKPKVQTVAQAADAVLAAFEAKDPPALRTLAARTVPDPWLVAEALCARERLDAARAYAGAAVGKDHEKLAAYVAARGAGTRSDSAVATIERMTQEAAAHRDQGASTEAEAAFRAAAERALAIGWLTRAATCHLDRARVAFKRNDWRLALAGLLDHVAVLQVRGDRRGMAKAYANIGRFIHGRRGQLRKAIEAMQKARALYEEIGDKGETAWALRMMGTYMMDVGDLDDALKTQERSLAIAKEIAHQRRMSEALLEIARIHKSKGTFAQAIPFAEQALDILVRLEDLKGQSVCLSTLGSIYSDIGDYERALRMQKRALAMKDKNSDRFNYGIALGNLGNLYARMGELDLARDHLERSLKIAEELNDTVGIAAALDGLGEVHRSRGENQKALDYQARALAMARRTDDARREATCLINLGYTQFKMKAYEAAAQSRAQAAAIGHAHGITQIEVKGLWGEALSRYAQGKYKRAGELAHQAERLLPLLLGGLSDTEGILRREGFTGVHLAGILAALQRDDFADAMFFVERYRAGALLEALGGRELAQDVQVPAPLLEQRQQARRAVRAARDGLTKAMRTDNRKARRAARQKLRAAQDAEIEAVQRIERHTRRGTLASGQHASLEELQGGLEAGDALVYTLLFGKVNAAVLLTNESARIVFLASRQDIRAAVARLDLHDDLTSPDVAVAELRKLVVEPLQLAPTVKRVLVVPDDALAYVPFALLLEKREVAYVPSGTTLLWLREDRKLRGTGVLAFGDPAYPRAHEATVLAYRGSSLETLARLPGTRAEVEAIGTHKVLGMDASEAQLARRLPLQSRWRAVHFACHGLANSQKPRLSALALAPDEANDGFLTCQEVFGLKIPADLAVLSACDTGRGATYRSEGIVGFTRAFMYAGCPRVLCSLWKVDDLATQALMVKFYELWHPRDGDGLSTAAALKQAQAFVRGHPKWKHPYYWAAWTLWGVPD